MTTAARLLMDQPRTGLRFATLSAGVVTPAERKGTIINSRWRPATGDFSTGGLGVYSAANAAVVDATLNGDFETDTTGWTNNAAGGVISRITTDSGFGSACLQTVNDGTGANQGPVTAALTGLTAGNTYTLGLLAESVSGATAIRVQIEWFTVLDASISVSTSDVTLTAAWQKFILTATAPALGVHAKVSVINTAATAATYNIDGVQLDNGGTSLPFDPANTRVAGRVRVAVEGLFTVTQGWVVHRLIVGGGSSTGTYESNWYDADNTTRISLARNTPNWQTVRISAGVGATATSQNITHSTGDHVTVGQDWTAALVGVSVSGTTPQTAANTSIPAIASATFDIGSYTAGASIYTGQKLWVLTGKGVRTTADISLIESWGDAMPSLAQIAHLSAGAYPTALLKENGDVILLPAYFQRTAP